MKKVLKIVTMVLCVLLIACAFTFVSGAENFEVSADTGVVTVAAEPKIEITHEGMIYLGKGNTSKVKATVTGVEIQPAIIWSSSDESVVTVDANGTLTGVNVGKADVVATAEVGGKVLTAKYPVKVVENENALNSYLEQHNILSFQYDYDNNCYYANDKKTWQKDYGFMRVYDMLAPYAGMEYDYIRVFFTYENQDFMLQLWKGQYVAYYGCEVGLYNKDHDGKAVNDFTFFNAVEDAKYWPVMDVSLYHQVEEGSDEYEFVFKRPTDTYWWCTGFYEGELRQKEPADELRMVSALTMMNEEMASLLAEGLDKCGFTKVENKEDLGVDSYHIEGKTVSICWQNISEAENTENERDSKIMELLSFLLQILLMIGWVEAAMRLVF